MTAWRAIFRNSDVRGLTAPVYTLRAPSATVSFWIVAAALALSVVSSAAEANWSLAAFALFGGSLIIWLLSTLLLAPAVYYNAERVVVVNFLRIHVLPWARIEQMNQGIDLVFTLTDGRRIHAYGAPYPRRSNRMGSTRNAVSGRNYDGDISILDGFRRAAIDTGAPATHRWRTGQIVLGLALVVLFLASTQLSGANF